MEEHLKLKTICDKIWYKNWFEFDKWYFIDNLSWNCIAVDVREIIFTPKFMNLFTKYYLPKWYWKKELKELYANIMLNLDNPVLYIYNLIK